jgi:hypothetical protein
MSSKLITLSLISDTHGRLHLVWSNALLMACLFLLVSCLALKMEVYVLLNHLALSKVQWLTKR